jgi:hypothetical protein
MIEKLFLIISILTFSLAYSQESSGFPCVRKMDISAKKRLLNYPFNFAAEVKLVSFEYMIRDKAVPEDAEEQRYYFADEIPKTKDGKVDITQLKEIHTATASECDALTDIFFNYGSKKEITTIEPSGCYVPRNAILFLNSKGEIFDYLEICFECRLMICPAKTIDFGDNCLGRLEMIKKVFENSGIKYGIIDR